MLGWNTEPFSSCDLLCLNTVRPQDCSDLLSGCHVHFPVMTEDAIRCSLFFGATSFQISFVGFQVLVFVFETVLKTAYWL